MVGFPLGWGDYTNRLGPPSDGCPISAEGIAIYLRGCEEHYPSDARRYQFGAPMELMRKEAPPYTLWLWRCEDTLGRAWYIVVGAGLGDAARRSVDRTRWLFAETAEDRSPDEFMDDAVVELKRGES